MKGRLYLRIILAVQLVSSLCMFSAAEVKEESVLFLRSGDDKIGNLISAGFQESFTGQVHELYIDKASKENVQAAKDKAPGMVVAVGEDAIKTTLEISKDVPVIFCAVDDVLLENISRENAFTITNETSLEDQLKSFKEFMPHLKTLGVIFCPSRSGDYIKEAEAAAGESGIKLLAKPAESIKGFPSAVREVIPQVDALWALSDPEFTSREAFNYILLIAFENNVPVVSSSPRLVKSGAVFAYAPDYRGVGERAAGIAHNILSGRSPSSDRVRIDYGQAVIN